MKKLYPLASLFKALPSFVWCIPALIFFIGLHVGFEIWINNPNLRPTIWETDDNYHYIVKTPLQEHCAGGACPAAQSLWDITQPREKPVAEDPTTLSAESLKFAQASVQHRSLLVYHPLYSAGLGALHQAGISYETGVLIINIAGHLLAALAILMFAGLWFGWPTAAISLVILGALWFFPGLSIMKPATLSSILSIAGLGCLALTGWIRLPLSFAFMALATGFHAVGGVFALFGAGLVAFQAMLPPQGLRPNLRLMLNPMLGLYGLGCLALLLFATKGMPLLAPTALSKLAYAEPSLAAILNGNARMLLQLLEPLAQQPGLVLLLLGVVIPPLVAPHPIKTISLYTSVLVAALVVANLFYPSPKASLLERIWPPLVVMLLSSGVYAWIWLCQTAWQNFTFKKLGHASCLAPAAAALAVGLVAVWGIMQGIGLHATAVKFILSHKNIEFSEPLLTRTLLNADHSSGLVLNYRNLSNPHAHELQEGLLYAALTYGGWKHRISIPPFQPVSSSTPLTGLYLQPFVAATGNDLIPSLATLTISQPVEALRFKNSGPAAWVQINGVAQEVRGHTTAWYALQPSSTALITSANSQVRLVGARLNSQQTTAWPWGSTLTVMVAGQSLGFDLNQLAPQGCRITDILDDTTSVVVATTLCQSSKD